MNEPKAESVPFQRRLYEGEKQAGWDPGDANTLAEEIAHLHEEISEAFRAFRVDKDCALTFDANGKPQGVPAELADAAIGMFYIAERWGFDLLSAIETKHRYNLDRSYAAEGRRLHEPVYTPDSQEPDVEWDEGRCICTHSPSSHQFGGQACHLCNCQRVRYSPVESLPEYDQHDHPQDCGGECG